jgi:hypothetical protein
MNVKTYMIVFYNPNINIGLLNQYIIHSPYVLSYWNYLPLVYAIKSRSNVNDLRLHFEPLFGLQNFLIAEINTHNVSGRLPPDAWPWFEESDFPPPPPPSAAVQVPPASVGLLADLFTGRTGGRKE